jgi:ribokinase
MLMRKPKITVVGSLNMDLVVSMQRMPKQGETMAGESIHYIPGGKGANQAVGCARLGGDVVMIGAVGDDGFGRHILEDMRRYGVSDSAISVLTDAPTGIASIFHTPEDNCIVIVPGANGKVTPSLIEQFASEIQFADIMLVQLEIPLNAVERALQIANEAGVRTVLNPAPAVSLPAELIRLCDIITPNESEFDILCGAEIGKSEELLMEGIIDWQERYGNRLVITRGKHGVSYVEDGKLKTSAAPVVEVVDTTGAGDCFNAAICFGIASGWEWERAVAFAVRAASLSVTKFGAQAGMPTLDEVGHVG